MNVNSGSSFRATVNRFSAASYTANGTPGGGHSLAGGIRQLGLHITGRHPEGLQVAGPGVAVGTPFGFTANGTSFPGPAGPAPGGTCVVVNPGFAVGSTVNIVETPIPSGIAVSNISVAVAPPGSVW